jgi:hypothetical protein
MTQPGELEELDVEAPEADAAEQHTEAEPSDEEDDRTPSIGIETPEWDALEQARTVRLEEDYQ